MQAQNPDFAPDQPGFFLGDPNAVMKRLRKADPLPWYEGSENAWCVLKHADVMAISRDPATYTSTKGIHFGHDQNSGFPPGIPPTILEMDPPVHNLHRKLVIGAFTPHATAQLENMVRSIARECIDGIETGTIADFVESLAVPVPMYVIAEMLGVPHSDRPRFKAWSDSMVEAAGAPRTRMRVSARCSATSRPFSPSADGLRRTTSSRSWHSPRSKASVFPTLRS